MHSAVSLTSILIPGHVWSVMSLCFMFLYFSSNSLCVVVILYGGLSMYFASSFCTVPKMETSVECLSICWIRPLHFLLCIHSAVRSLCTWEERECQIKCLPECVNVVSKNFLFYCCCKIIMVCFGSKYFCKVIFSKPPYVTHKCKTKPMLVYSDDCP